MKAQITNNSIVETMLLKKCKNLVFYDPDTKNTFIVATNMEFIFVKGTGEKLAYDLIAK